MTRKRKICAVVFGPSLSAVSGVSTHVKMLLDSRLADTFDLLHFQVGSEGRNEGGFGKIWRLATSPFLLVVYLLWHRPQIVHINTSLDAKAYWRDSVYLVIARLLRRKVVNQIHGGALPQTFFPGNRILTGIVRKVLCASTAVTVLSRKELAAYRAFDSRINVHLTPNAVKTDDLLDSPHSVNLDGALRAVYIGRLVASKGLFEAVEALRLLNERGHHLTLQIAGQGQDEGVLKRAVQDAGLGQNVVFLGPVFGAAKTLLWLSSDLFVFPTWYEGLPYAILEAMAAGCVPVTCPVGAIPDVMQNDEHGLFVPAKDPEQLANALAHLDLHRDDLARMAAAARARIRTQYTTTRLAEDFRRLYLSL